ncbi:MAG: glycosyltransferase family 4 protein [Burkholderiales bacterium]|nr:glycosyltransferase family 4 protein [Burkholderiales bacterium]
MSDREVVMLCTAARGGMRAVVEGYRDDGVFAQHRVRWIVTHDEGSLPRRLRLAASAWLALLALLLRRRVALVHSHMAMRGSFWRKSLFNATARAFGVPVLAHLHGSEFRQFHAALSPRLQRRVAKEFEACAGVLVLSEAWAAFVRGVAPRATVTVLPNYVRLPALPADAGAAPDGGVTGLFLGVIGKRKGVYDLLPALAQALRQVPGLRLLIGGNGEVERARARSAELGIDRRVEFLGWVSGGRKAELLSSAQFYVLPSHNEGLPMSLLEAMAHGLPVISTRVGGIPELVRDGIDGLLVEPGDVRALTDALVRVGSDDAWRAAAGRSGRERVAEAFSDQVVLPRLASAYAAALAGSSIGRAARGG